MAKLHEILAVEKQSVSQLNVLHNDTFTKFSKDHFFKGWIKRLKMLVDNPTNAAIETAGSESREVVTTVGETLDYFFQAWAKAENIQVTKNRTNQKASADIVVDGEVLVSDVPVDELMGLENRLVKIRDLFHAIPTLDATKTWSPSSIREGVLKADHEDVSTKTEKVVIPVVLYEATKEHPAQIKEMSRDDIVGTYRTTLFSGAVSSLQKAHAINRVEKLLEAVKQSRMRANSVEVVSHGNVGNKIAEFLMVGFSPSN